MPLFTCPACLKPYILDSERLSIMRYLACTACHALETHEDENVDGPEESTVDRPAEGL